MMATTSRSNLTSGIAGGLVVAAAVLILLAAGVFHTGSKTVVEQRQAPTTVPAADTHTGPTGSTVAGIYRKVGPGVAFIQARVQSSGGQSLIPGFDIPQQQGTATGSGFALDKRGYILTNGHVVQGAKSVTVQFGNQDPVDASIVGRDPSTDLAVLKVDPSKTKLHPLSLGDSTRIQVGDEAIAIGNPFGLENTVTTGIISAVQRSISAPNGFSIDHVIQTDASINPGNSGGPLLDGAGRVIGINAQIETGGSGNGSVGIGFAIPINTAREVVPQLEANGHIDHSYIGVTTAPVTAAVAKAANLPVAHGALIQDVSKGSPAAKAGLRAGHTQTSDNIAIGGDLIVAVAGKAIHNPEDISGAISGKKPGDTITIRFYRGRSLHSVDVTLAKRPSTSPNASQQRGGGGNLPQIPLP